MGRKPEKPTYEDLEKELLELKRSQAEWAKLFQVVMQSPKMIIIMDPEGVVEYVNQRFIDISGYTEEDMLGKKIPLFEEKSLEKEKEIFEQLSSGKILQEEFLNRKKDGSTYWENASVSTVKDNAGVITHIIKIAEEISDHKEIADSIIDRERKYRSVIETMPEGYFEVDLAGNFTFVNEVMAMIHGRPRNELIGLNYKEYTAPEEQERIYKIYNKVYKTGLPSEIHDYEITAGDGSRTISEVLVTLIRDASGAPVGFQGNRVERGELLDAFAPLVRLPHVCDRFVDRLDLEGGVREGLEARLLVEER